MTLHAEGMGSFGDLAKAVGLLEPSGSANSTWFGDPAGDSSNPHGLRHVLADDDQRGALLNFVDEVLGPPAKASRDGQTWVPLFANEDPKVTVSAVVKETADQVRIGIGLEHTTSGGPPRVSTRLHVPLLRVARRGQPSLIDSDGVPDWLMLGRAGGRVEVAADATFSDTPSPPGTAGLGGLSLAVGIPTHSDDNLSVALELRDLQLPGAPAPRSFTLDAASLEELGTDVLDLLAGLVRAQAEALDLSRPELRPFGAIAGLLGLRDVAGVPPLPLADLPAQGIAAIVHWAEGVLADNTARDAWLGQLAVLVGGTLDAANDAVVVQIGPMRVAVGLGVRPGTGGHPVLIPFADLSLDTRSGVRAVLRAELFAADTGTGSVTALPDARLEAVFGADAGGSALLAGPDPAVGSLHAGVRLDATGRPAFLLTLHDVTVGGAPHALLDLSSPEAAVDSAASVVTAALSNAIAGLGPAGELVNGLIGLDPPDGVSALDVTELLADPLGTVMGYWQELTGNATATADILGRLRRLITGAAPGPTPGAGTAADPWRVELAGGAALHAFRDGQALSCGLAWSGSLSVLRDHAVAARLALTLWQVDFAARRVTFAAEARGTLALRRADATPARLRLGSVTLEAASLGAAVAWTPSSGLRADVDAEGLAVTLENALQSNRIELSLSTVDWAAAEKVLAALLAELRVPAIDALVGLTGWSGTGARLDLGALLTGDPAAAVRAWFAGLILDCDNVRAALAPVAALLSGFHLGAPVGSGNPRSPYRCPVAGEQRAPGLAVWMEPGCPPDPVPLTASLGFLRGPEPPETASMVAVLHEAGEALPDLADLLVGRDSLAGGFDALVARWAGTDGLAGQPATMPSGVTGLALDGLSYAELVALGRVGMLAGEVLDPLPAAVLHVGCESTWDRGAASIPATGGGVWFARLPTTAQAAADRPDRGGVGQQAFLLAELLAARTEPIAVIAYGAVGAAAIRAATTVFAISAVVTVGTPWVELPMVDSGLGGDALRLLGRLRQPDRPPWPDPLVAKEATPGEKVLYLVTRNLEHAAGALPNAAPEPRRSGLDIRAVFGSLDEDTLALGIGSFLADGILARFVPPVFTSVNQTALHAGIHLPVLDLNLGGLLVGLGATLELVSIGETLEIQTVRGVTVDVQLGVVDGWIAGGPGTTGADAELRWLSARIVCPLDGRPGDAEFVLHEARGLGIDGERWVVRADSATPEARAVLSAAIGRIRAASPQLATLLDQMGLTRDGGLDPDGLDRLLHDTAVTLRSAFTANPSGIAAALRALIPAATGAGSGLEWTVGPAGVGVDLASGAINASLRLTEPALTIEVNTATGITATLGAIDPASGGLRLVASSAPALGLRAEWAPPGAPARNVALLPNPDPAALEELARLVLPAALAHGLLTAIRGLVSARARPALEAALDAAGLLKAADPTGERALILPIGLLQDPGAWLRRRDMASSVVALLDALAPIIVPDRGTATGWPVASGPSGTVVIGYSVESGGVLRLAAQLALTAGDVTTSLSGGLRISAGSPPSPLVEATVSIGGRGLHLAVGGTPAVLLDLIRPAPASALRLYPDGPGLGQALAAIGETVLPPVLNAITAHRTDSGTSLIKDVGQAVFDLGTALDLIESGQFTAGRITAFAADPAVVLMARLPQLIATGAASLARALDPAGTVVAVTGPTGNRVTLGFGSGQPVSLVLDASGPLPAVELRANVRITGIGQFTLDWMRLSSTGVEISARLGPVVLDAGAATLRPLLAIRTGPTRMAALGLALDDAGTRSVQVRWALDATPPGLVAVHSAGSGETTGDAAQAAGWLLAVGLSLAGGVAAEGLRDVLNDRARACLRGVVFTDTAASSELDPQLALDLLDPPALLARLKRLLWNAADAGISLTIDDAVTIGLGDVDLGGGRKAVGVNITLAERFTIAEGDTKVELEVDAGWVNPEVPAGLGIYVLAGSSASTLDFEPAVSIAGLGLRFTKTGGPLLSLGPVALDGFAVHLYGEVNSAGIGGGFNLELAGLAFSPGGGGGGNAVASGILNDAGQSSAASRPAFSPSLAIQKHPGLDPSVTLRAGPPPGPWWLVIQRQLGPLYLERVGFDTAETGGTVSRISLLFDGRVAIFGLTAAVDQLSISWLGGDVLDPRNWAVDLMGLAISADMSGVTLAGGLLKDVGPPVSYVGMLLGRFGTYGLTVFGGYTDDNGNPSFFVFGGINGPIGGPPAFFVTGIGGGLGINRALRIPADPSTFNTFPFIQALDPAARPPDDPMAELRRLNVYFGVERGTFWFAAGISFNCFTLVDGIAVVAVAFGNGLEINLLGLARMALPRPGVELVSIELGLLARFSTSEGIFMIRAALTENSWLLYREVRLTGGFAFVIWWKGPLAGQFVLSLGGYHPDFHRDGYPDVPRLGLSWRISDAITIKGGSYFALTSEALMAGVDIEVSADFGFAWARIAFGAHGIVYFDPFWFEVLIYARISAGIKIDTFFGTISISISLGAQIRVWGPDFSGEATIEIGPASITVGFGSQRKVAGTVYSWPEFVAKYLEDAGGGTARALSAITGKGTLPSATGGDRSAPTADGTAERPFEVYAEFEIAFVTTIPATRLQIAATASTLPVSTSDGRSGALGLKPMKRGNLAASMRIGLERKESGSYAAADTGLAAMQRSTATSGFPIGTWGAPDPDGLPAPPLPQGDVLNAVSTVVLAAVATSFDRGPEIDYYKVEASRRTLPLRAGGVSREELRELSTTVHIAHPVTADEALEAAASLLAPARSGLAAAAYRGEVSAPPLFGTLAEGLATANGADAEASRVARGSARPPRGPRPPVVLGYLTGGTGVTARPPLTTVSNPDLPRVPAPILAEVRTRLTRTLPAALGLVGPEAKQLGETLAAHRPPRTVLAAATQSYGLAARDIDGLLNAGDLIVLRLPDPAARQRPALRLEGKARVVALRGDGEVAADVTGSGTVPVPQGTALLAVQADPVPSDGLAGWHAGSRVATIGTHTAIGPGCVLTVVGLPTTPKAAVWTTAGQLVAETTEIVTAFRGRITAIAVAADGSDVDVELLGATTLGPPRALLSGTQAVLVYAIEPAESVSVKARQVTAVIGGELSADDLAADLIRRGITGVTARVAASSGPGCRLSWLEKGDKNVRR